MTGLGQIVRSVCPRANKDFVAGLDRDGATLVIKWGLSDKANLAHFLAQCAVETQGYTKFIENMNYSAHRIAEVWPSRFPSVAAAAPYAGQPEALANKVYANRMGNGSPASGDGWRHRGSGLLHHTGAAEYRRVKLRTGVDPDDLRNGASVGALIAAAGSYWQDRLIPKLVATGDVEKVTRGVNGGVNGLKDRRIYTARFQAAIQGQRITATERTTVERRDNAADNAKRFVAGGAAVPATTTTATTTIPTKQPEADLSGLFWAGLATGVVFLGVALAFAVAMRRHNQALENQANETRAMREQAFESEKGSP